MPKNIEVTIETLEGEFPLAITSKTMGNELVTLVNEKILIIENPFFNLQYEDEKDSLAFLKPDKKVLSHDLKKISKDERHHFTLLAQYFPELISEELQHPMLQRLLWIQIRKDIVSNTCYAPPELCVLFAAQSLQADHGDYDPSNNPQVVTADHHLPQRVLEQHDLTHEQWADRICNAWNSLNGTPKQQSIQDYLSVAQDLEQYGVTYFEIHNKKGTKLWLGVHNLGMDIYEYHNKVGNSVMAVFHRGSDKKFSIKMVDTKAPDFKFFSPRYKLNKRILALCVGNHQLYVTRRKRQIAGEGMVEDRAAIEAKIRRTKEHLLAIRADLEAVKDVTKETNEDRIHQEAEAAGMDRYKTMKKAQSGDTTKRIEMFEDLEDTEC